MRSWSPEMVMRIPVIGPRMASSVGCLPASGIIIDEGNASLMARSPVRQCQRIVQAQRVLHQESLAVFCANEAAKVATAVFDEAPCGLAAHESFRSCILRVVELARVRAERRDLLLPELT